MHAEAHSLRKLEPDYFLQRFTAPPLVFEPGQFVMVKPAGSLDPFLPRAYSILRVQSPTRGSRGKETGVVEILYRVVGKGTTALSRLKSGDRVDLLGPFGNGYHVPPSVATILLVAGGIGVPPVVALAERIAASQDGRRSSLVGRRSSERGRRTSDIGRPKMVAFVGGKTSTDVLCLTDLRMAGARIHVATEDGSLGQKGLVTDLLESYLRSTGNRHRGTQASTRGPADRFDVAHRPEHVEGLTVEAPAEPSSRRHSAIYACGPHAMLHAVARIAERFEVPCQVSLEADMACGFGACMACVIPVHSSGFGDQGFGHSMNHEPSSMNQRSYKLCCKDGPVFDAREIAW